MTQSNFRPVLLCGMAAVQGCFKTRPKAIKRLWHLPELAKPLTEVCKWMAQEKLSYSASDDRELSRVLGHAVHHGVVAATERPPLSIPKPSDYEEWQALGEPLLFLDDVADPLQVGTVARIAAATGIKRLLLSGASTEAVFHERAWSTAKGALDQLRTYDAGQLPSLLRALRERFCVVGFTRPGGRRVDDIKPIRVPGKPLAIIIGDTETGVANDVVGKCEHLLHIPGIGGSTLLNAGDTAAFGLTWLLRKERKPEGEGFLARKKAKKAEKAK
ncbi:MAG: hypothetical protein LBV12_03410 [Puniceicoccales bacterium]|jgi:TrmH RNA methyltransferase|nr:hypothetical protein [Puniceicoccales bacterium]